MAECNGNSSSRILVALLFGLTHFVARSLLCRLLRDEGESQRHGLKCELGFRGLARKVSRVFTILHLAASERLPDEEFLQ
jgi:hypothetical protein